MVNGGPLKCEERSAEWWHWLPYEGVGSYV
jgi:hypothetical protein